MWNTHRPGPASDWTALGGGFPLAVLPECPRCRALAGEACHAAVRFYEPGSYVAEIQGGTMARFPSVHADRYTLYREGGVQLGLFS